MNNEENDNHILIEVLNKNGDLKLTKFRNPRVIFQNNDYPDEYIFRDVDIVNIFQLLQENQSLKKENKILRENAEHNDKVVDKFNWENQKLKKQLEEYKHKGLYNTCLPYSTGYNKAIKDKENQQKEFVDYLENEKNIYPYNISDYTYEDIINTILSKYYEIIEK